MDANMRNGNGNRAKSGHAGAASRRVVRRTAISHSEFYQVCRLLESHRQELTSERPAPVALAERVGREIGVSLSPATIRRAMRAVGLEWTPPRKVAGTSRGAGRIRQIEADISVMASRLAKLCDALYPPGADKVEDLQAIAQRYAPQSDGQPTLWVKESGE